MNELSWKTLGVFYDAYDKLKDLLSSEIDAQALGKTLSIDTRIAAPILYDTIDRLKGEGYIQQLTHNTWRLTREGRAAWEDRPAEASLSSDPEVSPVIKKTMFVEADSLDRLQEKVNQRAAEGWGFVSLSVAIAFAPSSDAHEGSTALIRQDMGLTAPRLYVAALQK